MFRPFIDEVNKKVVEKFTKEFDEKKEKLLKELDEKRDKIDKDVLSKFMKEFGETANKIETELSKYAGQEEIISETTRKGEKFEDYVFNVTSDIAKTLGDYAEHIGGDDDTVDIIVESGEKSFMFCLEAKDRTIKSQPEIVRIFKEVEMRRGIQYSIIVFRHSKLGPEKVGPFRLYGTNRLVLALSESEDENMSPFLLNIGYKLMKLLSKTERENKKVKDVGVIKAKVEDIRTKLTKISSVKKKITEFSTDIRGDLDNMKSEIEELLDGIDVDLSPLEGAVK